MAVQAGRLGRRSGLRSAASAGRPAAHRGPPSSPGRGSRRRPRSPVDGPAPRSGRAAGRTGSGLLLGAIAIIFVLGFFSLAQTVQVSTTAVDIDRLTNEQSVLQGQRQQVISDLNRLGGASAIRKEGIDLGLDQLGDPVIVPAR